MIKYLILSCLSVYVLIVLAACASDEKQSTMSATPTPMMAPDSKDMTHLSSGNSH